MEGVSSNSYNHLDVNGHGNPGSNSLNIMYFSAQSLLPKMDKLRALVDAQKPHIVETWLSPTICDNEVSLEGFQVLRLDRNRHGGGIIMLIHNSLVPKVVVAGPYNLELLIISVTNQVNTCKHHLGLFYRPPSSGVQCLDDLYNCLAGLDPLCFSSFVLIGDFNIDFCNHSHFLFSHLCTILHSFSFQQVVEGHTHISPTGSTSCIDLALVTNSSLLQKCEVIPPLTDYSHGHFGLLVNMKRKSTRRPTVNKNGKRTIWKYAQVDFAKASSLIDETNWDLVLTSDVNEFLISWETKFMEIIVM